MKKFFVILTLLTALIFVAACGGGSSSGSESSNQNCTPGEFECVGSESYYCNSLGSLVYDARCENGCNDATGKCNGDPELCGNRSEDPGEVCDGGAKECTEIDSSYTGGYAICKSDCSGWNTDDCQGTPVNPGNDNTDSGDSSDSANDNDNSDSSDTSADLTCTTEGAFRCNGDLKQECKSGTWNTLEECNYGCDPVTKKCLGSTECKTGEYECIAGNLSYCNNNFWEIKEKCEYGCDAAMKQCLPEDCYTTRIYLCGDSKEAGFSYASYYCEHGEWHYDTTCPGDCDKSTGKCKAVCTSGEYKCEENYSKLCKDGFWRYNESCNKCNPSTGKCYEKCSTSYDGKYKCSDNNSMLCKDGVWEDNESCTYGCNESTGKCKVCTTIDGKTWSNKAESGIAWQDAKDYCDNLTECGYSNWRLPTITELRTLIQNCPGSVTGGGCKVNDTCSEMSSDIYTTCKNSNCYGCDSSTSGKYSKLGDLGDFWSSTVQSNDSSHAWGVNFYKGEVNSYKKSDRNHVRCVRQSK